MIFGVMLFCILLFATSTKANAQINQTAQTQNSITIAWSAEEDAVNYKVYIKESTASNDPTLLTTLKSSQTSYTINNLKPGTEYYVIIKYDYESYSGKIIEYTGSSEYVKTLPGKVTGLKQDRWYYFALSFYAVWDKQSGADGYEYKVLDSKGKVKAAETLSYMGFSVNKISNSMIYTGQVRAFSTINGKNIYGEWSDQAYFFTQPRIKKSKVSKNTLTVKWGKVSGATGYDIYVSTKPTTGYKKVKSVGKKASSVKIKKFKKKKISGKKKYYVYVATKKKVGNRTYTSGRLYYWNTKNTVFGYF
jgi:hypothetical protein